MTSISLLALFITVNVLLFCVVIIVSQCSRNKHGFYLSSCSDDYTELKKWVIHYQAASRSQRQYKDEIYCVDEGTL